MEEEEVLHISSGSKQISMDRVEIPQLHEHPLVPFTRFEYGRCEGCSLSYYDHAGRRGIFVRMIVSLEDLRCIHFEYKGELVTTNMGLPMIFIESNLNYTNIMYRISITLPQL